MRARPHRTSRARTLRAAQICPSALGKDKLARETCVMGYMYAVHLGSDGDLELPHRSGVWLRLDHAGVACELSRRAAVNQTHN